MSQPFSVNCYLNSYNPVWAHAYFWLVDLLPPPSPNPLSHEQLHLTAYKHMHQSFVSPCVLEWIHSDRI